MKNEVYSKGSVKYKAFKQNKKTEKLHFAIQGQKLDFSKSFYPENKE